METLNRRQFLSFAERARPAPFGHWLHVSREAMACRFEVTLPASDPEGISAARLALDEIERLEAQLTVFRETSEVSAINRRAGEAPVEVEPSLFNLLSLAEKLHRETEGAFDLTAGPLIRCWGFFRRQGRVPDAEELEVARRRVGMSQLALNAADRTVRFLRPGVEINLGAIGKGHALDQVATSLRRRKVGDALLSGGSSSVVAVGGGGGGWLVGIRNPRRTGARVANLRMKDCALATSGAGEQYFVSNGRRYGHIFDPRTGVPAEGIAGVSVVAASGAVADALSTAFFVGGSGLAGRYCANHPGVLALVVPEDPTRPPEIFGSHPGVVIESLAKD